MAERCRDFFSGEVKKKNALRGGGVKTITILKQFVVSACVGEGEYQFLLVLCPNQKPIGLKMALPKPFVLAVQLVRSVFGGQLPFFLKYSGGGFEDFLVAAPLHTSLQGFLETVSEYQTVHRYSNI